MALKTTVFGAFPKPDYLSAPDWYRHVVTEWNATRVLSDVRKYNDYLANTDMREREDTEQRAIKEVIDFQVSLGVDVITDGHIKQENYIHHFCRQLKGIDFTHTADLFGDGNIDDDDDDDDDDDGDDSFDDDGYDEMDVSVIVPTVLGPIHFDPGGTDVLTREWRLGQDLTSTPVKYTIPGPMTIVELCANSYYTDLRKQIEDVASCINEQVRSLVAAGCKHIQIDEPVLVRMPEDALDFGIDVLKDCFEGAGDEVEKSVHVCSGFIDKLGTAGVHLPKADYSCLLELAEKLDNAGFDAISIEDAERHNNLSVLDKFQKTSIILGVIKVINRRVESVDEIRSRVQEVLKHVPPERLQLAPDCGLGFLPMDILEQKLTNMITVAKCPLQEG